MVEEKWSRWEEDNEFYNNLIFLMEENFFLTFTVSWMSTYCEKEWFQRNMLEIFVQQLKERYKKMDEKFIISLNFIKVTD